MLSKRIIPCLDVRNGKVVKGVRFRDHKILGEVLALAKKYRDEGADELVFYDITASSENRSVSRVWIQKIAEFLDIPFCVAGGIRSVEDAKDILNAGADKISVNSPALERPELINELVDTFGSQCVVLGVDSLREDGDAYVYQYTGSEKTIRSTKRRTIDWLKEGESRGAGEIVLNCIHTDGVGSGYDIEAIKEAKSVLTIPVIASGGAGSTQHFVDVFQKADADAALAAGVFHRDDIKIQDLKRDLKKAHIEVR